MFRILVTGRNFGAVSTSDFNYFLDRGYEVVENPFKGRMPNEEELCGAVGGIDAILIGNDAMTEKVLSRADRLKVIAKSGIGVDNVDLSAASARGIAVTNVPGTTADSVADLTFGLMLCVSKLIIFNNRRVMGGQWPVDRGNDICGKTLGIVGFGRIGQAVAKRAAGFGMTTLAYDPVFNHQAADALGVTQTSLDDITERSDYVTIHIPKTPETTNLFDAARLRRMKQGAFLINAARGGVVDEDALYDALQSGPLAGAASDVLAKEPPEERPRLFDCDNFIVTSHMGGNSKESITKTSKVAAENIIAVLEKMPCPNIVNEKELHLV